VYVSLFSQAYFHKPLFSSGGAHGDDPEIVPIWQALYNANADVVVGGHDHDYERFAPQTALAKPDPERGIREFVLGTGGKNSSSLHHTSCQQRSPQSRHVRRTETDTSTGAYDWQFIPEAGKTFHRFRHG
jgi:hypothetical protein